MFLNLTCVIITFQTYFWHDLSIGLEVIAVSGRISLSKNVKKVKLVQSLSQVRISNGINVEIY